MEIKRVSIIGQGALGVMYGSKMAQYMPKDSLCYIADEQRAQRYIAEGVYANGERCNFTYIQPGADVPPADLVIFAVKATTLDEAVRDARSQVGKDTLVISVLNGISSEGVLARAYGEENVLYCVAQEMDATKVGPHLRYGRMGTLVLGEKNGPPTPRVLTVAEFLRSVGVACQTPDNMQFRQWSKFMMNVGVNQTSMVYNVPYAGLQAEGEPREAMLAAMREVLPVAQAEGIPLTEQDLQNWLGVLASLSPELKPSMGQDADAKRPSEVELFAGTVLRLAKKHGIAAPVNQRYYDEVKRREAAY